MNDDKTGVQGSLIVADAAAQAACPRRPIHAVDLDPLEIAKPHALGPYVAQVGQRVGMGLAAGAVEDDRGAPIVAGDDSLGRVGQAKTGRRRESKAQLGMGEILPPDDAVAGVVTEDKAGKPAKMFVAADHAIRRTGLVNGARHAVEGARVRRQESAFEFGRIDPRQPRAQVFFGLDRAQETGHGGGRVAGAPQVTDAQGIGLKLLLAREALQIKLAPQAGDLPDLVVGDGADDRRPEAGDDRPAVSLRGVRRHGRPRGRARRRARPPSWSTRGGRA